MHRRRRDLKKAQRRLLQLERAAARRRERALKEVERTLRKLPPADKRLVEQLKSELKASQPTKVELRALTRLRRRPPKTRRPKAK